MFKSFRYPVVTILLLLRFIGQGQTDSLEGFDCAAVLQFAQAEGLSKAQTKNFIAFQEQQFVKKRFGIGAARTAVLPHTPTARAYGCAGNDFESDQLGAVSTASQLTGWDCSSAINTYSNTAFDNCNMAACCPSPPAYTQVLSQSPFGYVNGYVGSQYPIFSVFGGSYYSALGNSFNPQLPIPMMGNQFLQLNNNTNGDYTNARISKSFTVTAANSLFAYAFMVVTMPDHACCESAACEFKVWNTSQNQLLTNYSYSVSIPGNVCQSDSTIQFYVGNSGVPYVPTMTATSVIYSRWNFRCIDLSPYVGQVITVEVTSADCVFGGHYNQVYFDAACWGLPVTANGGSSGIVCPNSATLSVGSIIPNISWSGPGNFFAPYSICSATTAGVYTVSIPNAPYPPITRTINLSYFPVPVIATPSSIVCASTAVTFSLPGMQTYTWSTGFTNAPLTTTLSAPITTIAVMGIDTNGCEVDATQTISVIAGTVQLAFKDTTICAGDAIVLSASQASTYLWSNGATSPSTGITASLTTIYHVTGLGTNGCPYDNSVKVKVDECVGLSEYHSNNQTQIFPNPISFNGSVEIHVNHPLNTVGLYNQLGQLVVDKRATGTMMLLSLDGLSPGTYVLKLQFENAVCEYKHLLISE